MKKIFTSILMIGLCTFLSAQSVLNVSGIVTHANGDVAEGIFLSLSLESIDEAFFTETNEEGYYEFAVDLPDDIAQGCFELFLLDCSFETILISDCFNPENTNFNFDFVFCQNGTDECYAFIFVETQDSFVVLSVLNVGVPDYTYIWSDGSTGETIVLPLDATGEYCVTITDSQDCVAESCIDLTPPDPCFVHIYEEYDWNSIFLYAEGYGQTDVVDYIWSTGETSQSINIAESGEYCVTLTDGLGCESIDCGYFEIDTTWNQDCFSYIVAINETDSSQTVLFVESFGVAPFSYVWFVGDSIISTEQSITPEVAGVYCVEVTDAEGCVNTTCYDYFIWEECGVWIGCDPLDIGVQLWAFGYGDEPIEYIWSNGTEGQELIVTESGEYCVTITDASGCSSSACLNVDVDGVPECFTPIMVTEFDAYIELTIEPITDGIYEFYWNTGEVESTITVTESGTYCVEVLEVASGCTFTTCTTVYIGGQEECFGWIETEYSGDSSAILSVFAVDMTSDSTAFEYLWSTGEVTETIEVFEEGTYCVTVFGANNCVFEACTDVIFWDFPWINSIFGVVYEAETGINVDATIDIYSVLDDGSLDLYSEGNETLEGGFFVVEDVVSGNYIALATANEEGYVPTYGYNTTSWESADIYQIGDNTSVIPLEISMIPITNVNGIGTISGGVSKDNFVANGKDVSSRNGIPVEGANIMLMHSEIPVGQIFTDEDGSYSFSGLPFGTYNVVLEIPGQLQKTIEVTLTEDDPNIVDVEFEAEDSPVSTENISSLSSLTLSPNPTSNTLAVDMYFEVGKAINYRIVDLNGKVVQSSIFNGVVGENRILLEVASLNNGVYNLVLQSNDELIAKRFIKL